MLDLYKNIRARRLELHMTQGELAKMVGYTNKSTIATLEAGRMDIPQSKILEFAKALDTTPLKLMGWDDLDEGEDAEIDAMADILTGNDPTLERLIQAYEKLSESDRLALLTVAETMAR